MLRSSWKLVRRQSHVRRGRIQSQPTQTTPALLSQLYHHTRSPLQSQRPSLLQPLRPPNLLRGRFNLRLRRNGNQSPPYVSICPLGNMRLLVISLTSPWTYAFGRLCWGGFTLTC